MARSTTFSGPVKSFRFAAAIASVGVSLAMPVGAVAAGSTTSTSSQITPTAPSRLTTTSATPTTTSATPTSTAPRGSLPNTGYDLLPETLLGLTLLGAGVGLRLRRARG
jgi:hypothetical protein